MLNELFRLVVLAVKTKSIADIMCTIFKYPYHKLMLNRFGKYVFMSTGIRIECPRKVNIGDGVVIGRQSSLKGSSEFTPSIDIGDKTNISEFVILDAANGYIKIGKRCTINQFSVLYGHGGLDIGDDVHIATKATIIPANHKIVGGIPLYEQTQSKKGIIIEDDVWIGANVSILDGITIGTGSVIGAGSVVTKSVPKYAVVVGVPACVIKVRGKNEE